MDAVLAEEDLSPLAVMGAATICIKEREPGLVLLCKERGWPLRSFSPEELAVQPGEFTPSAFVRQTTGVDNVCERAAVAASGGGKLLVKKRALEGVTAAVAAREITLRLEEKEEPG